jgi:hypothetical protein
MSDDADKVLQQREELKLPFPTLSGQGLKHSYAVEATPKFVVLDGAGIVRGAYIGWGRETPGAIAGELKHWIDAQDKKQPDDDGTAEPLGPEKP